MTRKQWDNPGPNARWCPRCGGYKFVAVARPVRPPNTITLSSDAPYWSHCAKCGARLVWPSNLCYDLNSHKRKGFIMGRVEVFALLLGGLWTFFKTSSWLYFRKNAHLERLYEALEVGVLQAWRQVVKPWLEKNGKEDKLPQHIREEAERVAIEEARKVDPLIKRFPKSVISSTLKMAVEEAKRRGGK
jgi:hypothetical protein